MKPTIYIETSVVSYYTSRPSRDLVAAAHQQITHQWWRDCLPHYECFVSELVIREASDGDAEAVRERLVAIKPFSVLHIGTQAERLARAYVEGIPQLQACAADALHLAIASASGMDYLVTWNCAHIARADIRRCLEAENQVFELETPVICTPEEIVEV